MGLVPEQWTGTFLNHFQGGLEPTGDNYREEPAMTWCVAPRDHPNEFPALTAGPVSSPPSPDCISRNSWLLVWWVLCPVPQSLFSDSHTIAQAERLEALYVWKVMGVTRKFPVHSFQGQTVNKRVPNPTWSGFSTPAGLPHPGLEVGRGAGSPVPLCCCWLRSGPLTLAPQCAAQSCPPMKGDAGR